MLTTTFSIIFLTENYNLGVVCKMIQFQTQLIQQNISLLLFKNTENWLSLVLFCGIQNSLSKIIANKRHSPFQTLFK